MSGSLKIILIIALTTVAGLPCTAQTFTNAPNDTIIGSLAMDEVTVFDIIQNNIQSDTIILSWSKVSALVPDQWVALICDNDVCYSDLYEGGTMIPVYTGQNGLMSLHVTAHVNPGTAIIQYGVWDNNYPTEVDTLTWIVSSFQTGINTLEEDSFTVFLSGNSMVIHRKDLSINHFQVLDLNGRLIMDFPLNKDLTSFDISNLSECIYFVKAKSDQRVFVQKIYIPSN